MKNSTHIFIFNAVQTKNGLKQKIRRNFSETDVCSLRYNYFRQNHNKTYEKNETDENFEEKHSQSQVEFKNLNPSKDKFKKNPLIESLMKINGVVKKTDKLITSQMLLPIAVLKGLSGSRESAVSALSSKMLSPKFKKKCIYNINKKFTHIFENNQEQQFRNMSSNNPIPNLSLLKNEIMLSNKYDKSPDSVILNVTVNIPLSDLNKDKRSNKLACSAKIDEILKLPADNKGINEDISPMKCDTSKTAPIEIENYNQGNFMKGKSKELYYNKNLVYRDDRSTTQKPLGEFIGKLVKNKSKLETINKCEARIRHEKVKNINKHVKMLTKNLQLSPTKTNRMVEEEEEEEDEEEEQKDESNTEMSHETNETNDKKVKSTNKQVKMLTKNSQLSLAKKNQTVKEEEEHKDKSNAEMSRETNETKDEKVKSINKQVKMLTKNSWLSPNKINQMIEEDSEQEENNKSNIKMSHETGLESYSKWLGRRRNEVNIASKESIENIKEEQSLACPGEKEKEIYMKKRLNNLEEPEHYDSLTPKPLKAKEQVIIKSVFNKDRILDDNKKFEGMSDNHDQKFKGKSLKSELYSHSLKYYPRKNSEQIKYWQNSEKQSIKDGYYKIKDSNNRKLLDWREQCSNINEPADELSYSLSDFKTRSSPYFSNISTETRKIYRKRNVVEKKFDRKRREIKESDRPQENQLKDSQISRKLSGEDAQNNTQNIRNYQPKNNLAVKNYKTDLNKTEDENTKISVFTENKAAVIEGPQNNERSSDNKKIKDQKGIKKENKNNCKKEKTTVTESEANNNKKIKSELSNKINKVTNKRKQDFNYPIRNTAEKKTKLLELTGTERGKCLACPQNKSLARTANSPQSQQESKIQLNREEQIAIKTAEFCKILLELVKLFSISAMKDIERSNKQNYK